LGAPVLGEAQGPSISRQDACFSLLHVLLPITASPLPRSSRSAAVSRWVAVAVSEDPMLVAPPASIRMITRYHPHVAERRASFDMLGVRGNAE
jgi:hypothetical protein